MNMEKIIKKRKVNKINQMNLKLIDNILLKLKINFPLRYFQKKKDILYLNLA